MFYALYTAVDNRGLFWSMLFSFQRAADSKSNPAAESGPRPADPRDAQPAKPAGIRRQWGGRTPAGGRSRPAGELVTSLLVEGSVSKVGPFPGIPSER